MAQKQPKIIYSGAGHETERSCQVRPEVVEQLMQFIRQIRYGEIVITIHDSKIVQVERREKTRFHD